MIYQVLSEVGHYGMVETKMGWQFNALFHDLQYPAQFLDNERYPRTAHSGCRQARFMDVDYATDDDLSFLTIVL